MPDDTREAPSDDADGPPTHDSSEPLPGLEPDPLPGLEPTEATSSPAPPEPRAAHQDAQAAPLAAGRRQYDYGEWTDAELDDWYENEYGGDAQYQRDRTARVIPDHLHHEFVDEYEFMEGTERERHVPWSEKSTDARLSETFLDTPASFSRLSRDQKIAFREVIEQDRSRRDSQSQGWESADQTNITITLPDGSQLTESVDPDDPGSPTRALRDREGAQVELPGGDLDLIEESAPAPAATSGGGLSLRPVLIGGGIFALAAVVAAFAFLGGGDSDGSGNGTPGPAASGSPAAAAAAVGDSGESCSALRQQQFILDLTSPDVQPAMPRGFAADASDDNGFASPRLDWSAVPPETTEVAIHVMSLSDERAAAYLADENIWWDGSLTVGTPAGIPLGRTRWTVTGIAPAATSLPGASLASPLPAGVVEQPLNGTGTFRDGVDLSNKFIGAEFDGDYYLFTVFALCDPTEGEPDEFQPGWFQRHAIAIGWFFTRAAW